MLSTMSTSALPDKQLLTKTVLNREHGVRTHVYKAPKAACRSCVYCVIRCGPKKTATQMEALHHAHRGALPRRAHSKPRWRPKRQKQIYRQRSQIAEFPHAWIKERCGLRQFRCRGQEKTSMEATWACLSYNIIRWFSIRRKLNAILAA